MDEIYQRLYRERILDYYKCPRFKGVIDNALVDITVHNPACGDSIRLTVGREAHAYTYRFEGKGCVISQASASMVLEAVHNLNTRDVSKILAIDPLVLFGTTLGENRKQCVLLIMQALKKAFAQLS